ncbi:MAG: ATP-binding protein [Bacteroidales bacterium]|nr:ATP-binding protein [Bacteroidales bacterium]
MNEIVFYRTLNDKIASWLFQGKVIILYGPRQVGKTTLVKKMIRQYPDALYMNCERQPVRELLSSKNLERIRQYFGTNRMVVFDEAQKVANIGEILKLLIDTYPEIQYLATGSSSFDLSNVLSEPLTGRNVKFVMYPVSLIEMSLQYDDLQLDEMLDNLLIYGSYPDIAGRPQTQKEKLLDELTTDYLFRDVLQFENLRRPDVLVNLLKAIALQIGNEVSLRELSNLLKIAVDTVQRYLSLLEKSFVLFSLPSFSRNLRNEISKGRKFYFYDLGIRNTLLQNYTPLSNRGDVGQLWENYCLVERIKYNQAYDRRVNMYFWRTYQQQEIDLIEEHSGELHAFEFKWRPRRSVKIPSGFKNAYPDSTFQTLSRENYREFLINPK